MEKQKNENRMIDHTKKHFDIDGHSVTVSFAEDLMPDTYTKIRDILLSTFSAEKLASDIDAA